MRADLIRAQPCLGTVVGQRLPPLFFKHPWRGQFLKGHDPWEGRGHQGAGWRWGAGTQRGVGTASACLPSHLSLAETTTRTATHRGLSSAKTENYGNMSQTLAWQEGRAGVKENPSDRRVVQACAQRGRQGGEGHLPQRQRVAGTLRDQAPRSASLARGRSLPPRPSPSCPAEKVLPQASHCSNGPGSGRGLLPTLTGPVPVTERSPRPS